jgi:hypothetical protein
MATNSLQLNFAVSGGRLQLTWPIDHTGWRLEVQTNSPQAGLGTNWTTVMNSMATNSLFLPLSQTNASVFFRLAHP